jgi:MFS family permease
MEGTLDEKEPLDKISRRINRLGCGNSQLVTFLVASFVFLCDGQEMLVMSLISLRLKTLWNLSPAAEGTLGSCVFAGVLVGSVISGAFSDKYGRRRAIIIFMSILAFAGLGSAVAPSFASLIILRTLAGVGLGGTIPTTNCLISEVVPDKSRAITMLSVGVGFTVGESVTALQSMALDINIGANWRWLLALSAFPAFLSLFVTIFCLEESPRYLNAIGKTKEANKLLNRMENQNKRSFCCCCCSNATNASDDDDDDDLNINENDLNVDVNSSFLKKDKTLRNNNHPQNDNEEEVDPSCCEHNQVLELFEEARPIDTLMVWNIFMIASVVFYGLVWVFPITLKEGGGKEKNNGVSSKVLFGAMAELPSIIIPIFFIDWIGRKATLALSFAMCIPIAVSCAIFAPNLQSEIGSNLFFWSVMGAKCMISVSFNVIYVYAAEYVPSKVRGFAIGMGSAASRVGGIATPYAMVLFHRSNIASPYWFMVVSCTVGLISSLVLKEVDKNMR